MKQIEIKTSKKLKWYSEEEEEKVKENRKVINKQQLKGEKTDDVYDPKEIPLTTIHIIELVIKRQGKGPHSEPNGHSVSDQRKIFKILDKVESLPEGATHLELEDAEFEFVVKKVKAYKERWWAIDRIFIQFETALGIGVDESEDKHSSNGQAHELEVVK